MLHDVLTNLCWRTPAGDASDGFSREMSMVIGTAVRRWVLAAGFLLLTAWVDPVAAQEAPPEPAEEEEQVVEEGAEAAEEQEEAEVAAEEDVRDEPVWRDRWDLTAELSYTDQSGNSELRLFTGGFRARHLDRDRFRLDLSVESRYGRSGGDVVARRNEGSLAFDLHPRNRWTPFVFTSAQQDPIRRLDLRLSSGFGAKYTLERARRDPDVSLSLALLHDFDRTQPQEDEPAETRHRARWSLRVEGGHRVNDNVLLQHTSFYEPVFDEMADYLLRTNTGTRVSLTDRLALAVSYRFNRNAIPPEGVDPDDHILQTGISINL
jgi:hypothetical protein